MPSQLRKHLASQCRAAGVALLLITITASAQVQRTPPKTSPPPARPPAPRPQIGRTILLPSGKPVPPSSNARTSGAGNVQFQIGPAMNNGRLGGRFVEPSYSGPRPTPIAPRSIAISPFAFPPAQRVFGNYGYLNGFGYYGPSNCNGFAQSGWPAFGSSSMYSTFSHNPSGFSSYGRTDRYATFGSPEFPYFTGPSSPALGMSFSFVDWATQLYMGDNVSALADESRPQRTMDRLSEVAVDRVTFAPRSGDRIRMEWTGDSADLRTVEFAEHDRDERVLASWVANRAPFTATLPLHQDCSRLVITATNRAGTTETTSVALATLLTRLRPPSR